MTKVKPESKTDNIFTDNDVYIGEIKTVFSVPNIYEYLPADVRFTNKGHRLYAASFDEAVTKLEDAYNKSKHIPVSRCPFCGAAMSLNGVCTRLGTSYCQQQQTTNQSKGNKND